MTLFIVGLNHFKHLIYLIYIVYMHISLQYQKKHVDYLNADEFSLCVEIFSIPVSSSVIHWL